MSILNIGDVIDGRYEIKSNISEGGMQYVFEAHDSTLDRKVALKTPKNPSAEKRFKRSAVLAAKINHPNIAKTLDYIDIDNRQYLIEELIDGGDIDKILLKKLKRIDPYLVAKIFHHLSKGIAASHHVGVIHRDLKPTNIMISGGLDFSGIKITDFGIAKMAEEEWAEAAEGGEASIGQSQTAVGALPYMAPEAIESPRDIKTSADIWSLGAMMYELLVGEKPFGQGLLAVSKIMAAQLPTPPAFITGSNAQFSHLSNQLIDVIRLCLQKDANARPTADQLVEHCSRFCYPTNDRYVGVVKMMKNHNAWGFIIHECTDVFFHMDSVYGDRPTHGSKVWFSKFEGEPKWRAHPVICIKETV